MAKCQINERVLKNGRPAYAARVLIVSYTNEARARAPARKRGLASRMPTVCTRANRHLFRQVTRHVAILLIIQIQVVTARSLERAAI